MDLDQDEGLEDTWAENGRREKNKAFGTKSILGFLPRTQTCGRM